MGGRSEMAWIKIPKSWKVSENRVTPEEVYRSRRNFLRKMAWAGGSAAALLLAPPLPMVSRLVAQSLPDSISIDKISSTNTVTPERIVSRYNNFYEFGSIKDQIWKMAQKLDTEDWKIAVGGLVKKPRVLDAETLIRQMPSEERIYRLRCVEAWAAVIPWTGFPLRKLIEKLEPLSTARFVKFTTFLDPNIAPGQRKRFWEPWPYTEGLSLEEAMHDLSFLATGIYGHALPPQHGAPIRLVVPWKHGFKSIKSIVRIDFIREEPQTFWQSVSPIEYDFPANVIPDVPYARWDQAFERIPGQEKKVQTKLYNGYEAEVAHLYK